MPNITNLPSATLPLSGPEVIPIVQGGQAKSVVVGTLTDSLSSTAVAAAAAASTAKTAAESARDLAVISENVAVYAQGQANNAALSAQSAQRIFASTTAGIAGTTTGQYFYVISSSSLETYEVWLNSAGTAVDTGKRLPTKTAISSSLALNKQFISDSGVSYWHWWKPADTTTKMLWADVAAPDSVYQDTAGATPITASGQSCKMLRLNYDGWQDYANLTENAYNDATNSRWTKNRLTAGGSAGASTMVPTAVLGTHSISRTLTKVTGVNYRQEFKGRTNGGSYSKVRIEFSAGNYADFNLSGAGTVIGTAGGVASASITSDGTNWTAIVEFVAAAASEACTLYVLDATGAVSYTADGTSGIILVSFRCLKLTRDHMIQATTGNAPIYTEEAGTITKKFLLFDGVDDFMKAADIDFSACSTVTLIMAFRQYTFSTTSGAVLEHGTNPTSAGFSIDINNTVSGAISGAYASSVANISINNGPVASVQRDTVVTLVFNPAGATADDKVRMRIDGVEIDETNTTNIGSVTVDAFRTFDMYMAMRAGTTLPSQIGVYGFAVYGRTLTDVEMAGIEATANLRMGNVATAAAAYSATPKFFTDCGATVTQTNYIETAPFATVEYLTDATTMTVTGTTGMFTSFPTLSAIGVFVNGVYNQQLLFTANGSQTFTVSGLGSGTKLVTLVNGPESSSAGFNPAGSYITSVTADRPLQQVFIPRRRWVFFGDSIANGQAATPVHQNAYVMQLRAALYPATASLKGWGSASLNQFASTSTQRHAFVQDLLTFKPDVIVLAIGTNDYGLNKWSAANFGTAYAACLDDLHTLAPHVKVYCQTPIPRSGEGANTFGDALSAYRTQISNAVSARSIWAVPPTLIDGTTQITTADLSDGIHPTTAGHTILANSFKSIFLLT